MWATAEEVGGTMSNVAVAATFDRECVVVLGVGVEQQRQAIVGGVTGVCVGNGGLYLWIA